VQLTDAQVTEVRGRGWTVVSGGLSPEGLARWRSLADEAEAHALSAQAEGRRIHGACVVQDPVGPRLMRFDDLLGAAPEDVLDLLACPAMRAVSRQLCGPGAVPLQVDLLYKHSHPHPVIQWHQGAMHPRGFPYLNVGIFLDDAPAGDGCVRYVPGTQHGPQPIEALSAAHGWDLPGAVEQPARAGDIVVQDMMILHASPPKRAPGVRRTLYVELRAADGITESGAQSARWRALRERWQGLVQRRAGEPGAPSDLGSDADEIAAIMSHREPPIPAVYSARPVVHPDYPVPADLR
jgi:hypothetical protein